MSMMRYFAMGGAVAKTYIEDVFSTYLVRPTADNTTYSIADGIDYSTHGGMFWFKARSAVGNNLVYDTARGASVGSNNALLTNSTLAQQTANFDYVTPNSTGVTVNFATGGGQLTNSGINYVGWLFRKSTKFFDVVTYTGDGVAGRQIAHSLGVAPGMIIVKCTNVARDWAVWHRSLTDTTYLKLNTTDAAITNNTFNVFGDASGQTSTIFTVGKVGSSGVNGLTNANSAGDTYVAYLFAHDTGADGLIQCGSLTTDGSGLASVTLGWEPQFVLAKSSTGASDWWQLDTTRGMTDNAVGYMSANATNAEVSTASFPYPTATGFEVKSFNASQTYVYLAIRRGPMKQPTSGTQVYSAALYTGNASTQSIVTGYPPISDLVLMRPRASTTYNDWIAQASLTRTYLKTSLTDAEGSSTIDVYTSTGFTIGNSARVNASGIAYVTHFFRRAPGVFDEVCYTGDGTSLRAISHNLTVAPELIIVKNRTSLIAWSASTAFTSSNDMEGTLNSDGLFGQYNYTNSIQARPTTTTITVGPYTTVNTSGDKYIAYLFATKAGISKVGSYTGDGTSGQTIDAGFSAGARFVLIKRTDSTGDWFVFDSARGIVAANDPHLSLNTTVAEVTTDDSVDPAASGFIVNQNATTNLNVTSATYIYLAIS